MAKKEVSKMPSAGTALLGAAAAKKGLERVVNDVYDLIKTSLKKKIAVWKAVSNTDQLYRKWRDVRQVKTIWQVEKAIDLGKFYCPSRIRLDGGSKQIDHVGHLPADRHILIQGTVGQGKSIFLRYLTSCELAKGKVIPLFCELRRLQPGVSLEAQLLEELESLGISIDSEILRLLFKNGKILLLLDAFDEVSEEQKISLVDQIERLCKRYEALRIIVSSRPNSDIGNCPYFSIYDLEPLHGNAFEQVIRRMAHQKAVADEIIGSIKGTRIEHLLTTPLMIALLMVRYRIDQSLPENEIEFFDDLFYLLLRRHDKTKAGYVRQHKSNLSDLELKEIFDAICFLSRKDSPSRLSLEGLEQFAKSGASVCGIECNVSHTVADIIEITCLILEEGGECRFVHKSVQEFHSASFISKQTDPVAKKFYSRMASHWELWIAELQFLKTKDTYRFMKWFRLPDLHKSIKAVTRTWPQDKRPTSDSANSFFCKYLKLTDVGIHASGSEFYRYSWGTRTKQTWTFETINMFGVLKQYLSPSDIESAVRDGRLHGDYVETDFGERCSVGFKELATVPPFRGQMLKCLNQIHRDLKKEHDAATKFVKNEEAKTQVFDF